MDDFRAMLNPTRLSDMLLTVFVEQGDGPCKRMRMRMRADESGPASQQQQQQQQFRVHAVVLAQRCSLFRSLLMDMGTAGPVDLPVTSAAKLGAFGQLLQLVYHGGAPQDAVDVADLPRLELLLQLADQVGADGVIDALLGAAATAAAASADSSVRLLDLASDLGWATLRPAWPTARDALRAAVRTAAEPFISLAAPWPPEQHSHFLAQPFEVVRTWADADRARCSCEEDVLLSLDAWVAQHPATPPAQLQTLADCVRVGLLSAFCISCMLPELRWFTCRHPHLLTQLVVARLAQRLSTLPPPTTGIIGSALHRHWVDACGAPESWFTHRADVSPLVLMVPDTDGTVMEACVAGGLLLKATFTADLTVTADFAAVHCSPGSLAWISVDRDCGWYVDRHTYALSPNTPTVHCTRRAGQGSYVVRLL